MYSFVQVTKCTASLTSTRDGGLGSLCLNLTTESMAKQAVPSPSTSLNLDLNLPEFPKMWSDGEAQKNTRKLALIGTIRAEVMANLENTRSGTSSKGMFADVKDD